MPPCPRPAARRLAALLAATALSLPLLARAQSTPGLQNGDVPTAAQWNAFFGAKADAANGTLTNPTINGGTLAGNFAGTLNFSGAGIALNVTQSASVGGLLDVIAGYYSNGTAGVSCSGAPTASYATVNGIVTHC